LPVPVAPVTNPCRFVSASVKTSGFELLPTKIVPSLSRSAIALSLAPDRACIVAVAPEPSTGERLDDICSPPAATSRFLFHNALMRKCNNAQRIDCERLLSRKQRAYYGRTRVWGWGI
jgi:hypothetical protein